MSDHKKIMELRNQKILNNTVRDILKQDPDYGTYFEKFDTGYTIINNREYLFF